MNGGEANAQALTRQDAWQVLGNAAGDPDNIGAAAAFLAESGETPSPSLLQGLVAAFYYPSSPAAHTALQAIRRWLASPNTAGMAWEALRWGLGHDDEDIKGSSAALMLEAGESPSPELLQALVAALASPRSPAAHAARASLGQWLVSPDTAGMAREALRWGLEQDDEDIKGSCAVLLLEAGEPPSPELLQGLVAAFYDPRSPAARTARPALGRWLASPDTADMAREALRWGLGHDDEDIRTNSEEVLSSATPD